MKRPLIAAALILLGVAANAFAQDPAEQRLIDRIKSSNGIYVGEPKVYDDAALQQMLAALQARLASLQVLDQGSIAGKVGAWSGVSQRINSFSITAQTPPAPEITTTEKGPTGSTVDTSKSTAAVDGSSAPTAGEEHTTQTTSGLAATDSVTVRPRVDVPTATAAAPSVSMPTAVGVSASDVLNEQMQLSYEVANLQLLLEGSLSDRMLRSAKLKIVKPRTTIGFPITLLPDKRHKNAVAVVEVEVEKSGDMGDGENPAITALLPREKTYNVASITESGVALGGGVVTRVLGFGGSWLRQRKTYYVVQDQDTLALTFMPETTGRSGFLWQFKPVLGREYVRSDQRQTFVQLAFPAEASAFEFGKVFVRTYWRRYDRRKGILKEVLPGSLHDEVLTWTIRNYTRGIEPRGFGDSSLEDLGDGQVLVKLQGRFPASTYVRIGNTIVKEGSGLTFEHFGMRFVARLYDAVSKRIALVARDGTEVPLNIFRKLGSANLPDAPPTIKSHRVSAVDGSNTLLELELVDPCHLAVDGLPPLVVLAGGKVYGYADAPIVRENGKISIVVPTAALVAHPEVTVTWLFAKPGLAVQHRIPEFSPGSRTEQLVLLEQGSASAKFLLYGCRLAKAAVALPAGVNLQKIGRPQDADTLRLIEMTADQIQCHKRIVLARPQERPVLIDVPAVEFKTVAPREIKSRERISLGSDEAVFEGEGLDKLKQVLFRKRNVPFIPSSDGRSVRLTNLKALGITSSAVAQDLTFMFEAVQKTATLEVLNGRFETVQKP
jgi:hypothetical protein